MKLALGLILGCANANQNPECSDLAGLYFTEIPSPGFPVSSSAWSALPGFILESKKCTGDCEDSYVQCIIDCKAGTDCQSRCARDYTNCNEHCPCYNFCYEGKLTLDPGSKDMDHRKFGPHDSLLAINLEKEVIGIFRCSFSI